MSFKNTFVKSFLTPDKISWMNTSSMNIFTILHFALGNVLDILKTLHQKNFKDILRTFEH